MNRYFPDWRNERKKLQEIHDYRYLIKRFPDIDKTNINLPDELDPRRKNRSYAKICNSYFRNAVLAMHDDSLLKQHYNLLVEYKKLYKNTQLDTFDDVKKVLKDILKIMPINSPHLASQTLHMLNNNLPICSRPILTGLHINPNNIEPCSLYEDLNIKINEFLISDKGQDIIKDFKDSFNNDRHILDYITDTKIIDFYFWLPTLDAE